MEFLTSFKNPITVCDLACVDFNIGKEQHLSRFEVQNIVKQLRQYTYILLTEHLPNGNFIMIPLQTHFELVFFFYEFHKKFYETKYLKKK